MAHRVELVRPIEASVARRARRVAICAAMGFHKVHTSPVTLRWREPLLAARGRGWASRVPERVLPSRWIAASLPAVRCAGEQVADEHARKTGQGEVAILPEGRLFNLWASACPTIRDPSFGLLGRLGQSLHSHHQTTTVGLVTNPKRDANQRFWRALCQSLHSNQTVG